MSGHLNVKESIDITNHIKAGNTDEAKKLIDKMSEFSKLASVNRIDVLLKRRNKLKASDVEALMTKKTLLTESIEKHKDSSNLRKKIYTTKERIAMENEAEQNNQ